VVHYADCVGCQPINDYRRPNVIAGVYRQAADTRDQGHQSRRPGIGRQPILLMLQQLQKKMKLEHIKCSGSIPCLRHLRQLCASVSAGTPISAAELVSADDLHLAQLRTGTIGCLWRAWGAEESPAGGKTRNIQMRISKARPRRRSSLLHNYMNSL
jgi:hypothetical protein